MKSFKIHLNFKLGERKRSGKQKCINNDKQGNHKTGQVMKGHTDELATWK